MISYDSLRVLKIVFVLWCKFGVSIILVGILANQLSAFGNMEEFILKVHEFISTVYAPLLVSLALTLAAVHFIFR